MTRTQDLIAALEDKGYDWRPYSGRRMYGARCVGVTLDSIEDLYALGRDVGSAMLDPPTTDSMGRGIVAYWPQQTIQSE
jgi:hypothetical protein